MSDNKTEYVIKSISDFLLIPKERQADFLLEFSDFMDTARDISELSKAVGSVIGANAGFSVDRFVWIDDGKKNRTVRIHTGKQDAKGGEG
jgi:hypothetical protein